LAHTCEKNKSCSAFFLSAENRQKKLEKKSGLVKNDSFFFQDKAHEGSFDYSCSKKFAKRGLNKVRGNVGENQ